MMMRSGRWLVAVMGIGIGAGLWSTRGLAQSAPRGGRALFEARCAGCHGLDARGGEAPAIGPGSPAAGRTNDRLQTIIHDGTPAGMPGFGALLSRAEIAALVRHLRTLQRAGGAAAAATDRSNAAAIGDAAAGRALFFGKAKCADCHMARGEGGFLGSDLTRTRLDAQAIREAILHPPASLKGVLTTVTLRDGQTVSGLVRNEDNFSLQLQDSRGAFHLIDKRFASNINRGAEPLMPADYRQRLSDAEVNNLASFVAQLPLAQPGGAAPSAKSP